ncbi:sulfotransferase family 2 domain-containing protein [Lichenicola cladoniae]|uniref:Sulfotransferase family 2 domain-containing protein n=1 Tax=Lichenicola cladoniae TaxID=1484109 RepID=A0A6M8HQR9_9PROT|nr:sulfotransferase family 2 domain-containing protein [Lichenicola cladoniae]NPD68131.1 sulfotransferase family 2 domain-containing protein [Acetobacteraceae bacterium]QKE90702.1 sulfotransferase family 2 domain-containing protein [Lichenicola cladoniae]
MIISHKYRFIFLKTTKTAGTSLEVFLSTVCAETDVVTPFGNPFPPHRPRNFDGFYNHIAGDEVRTRVGDDIWNEYFKFCVVRNPWDKVISHYSMVKNSPRHRNNGNPDLTLDEYLEQGLCNVDYSIYTDQVTGAVLVNHVARYESLEPDLQRIMGSLAVPFDGALHVRAKGHFRTDRRHYREILNTRQAEHIAQIYSHEIKMNGYSF